MRPETLSRKMRKLTEFRTLIGMDGHWILFLGSFSLVSVLEVAGVGLVPLFFAAAIDPLGVSRIPFIGRWIGPGFTEHLVPIGLGLVAFFAFKNVVSAVITFLQSRYVAR